jgi:hypothetical protein
MTPTGEDRRMLIAEDRYTLLATENHLRERVRS